MSKHTKVMMLGVMISFVMIQSAAAQYEAKKEALIKVNTAENNITRSIIKRFCWSHLLCPAIRRKEPTYQMIDKSNQLLAASNTSDELIRLLLITPSLLTDNILEIKYRRWRDKFRFFIYQNDSSNTRIKAGAKGGGVSMSPKKSNCWSYAYRLLGRC